MQLKAPITYNIYDGDKLVFKTKSATKASDYRVTNGKHLSIMAIDSIGNTKKLYADGGGVGELKVGDKVELRMGGDSKRGVVVSPPSNGKVSVEVEFTDVLSKRLTKMKMAFPISSIHKLSTMANGGGVETESTLRKRFEGYTDEELQIYNGDNAETLKNWNRKDAIQEAIDAVNEEGEEEERFTYKDIYTSQGGMTFETEEEVKKFIKRTKPFIRKQLKEGNFVVVFNGKEYYIAEKIKHNEYGNGGGVDSEWTVTIVYSSDNKRSGWSSDEVVDINVLANSYQSAEQKAMDKFKKTHSGKKGRVTSVNSNTHKFLDNAKMSKGSTIEGGVSEYALIEKWLVSSGREYDDWNWNGSTLTLIKYEDDSREKITKEELIEEGVFSEKYAKGSTVKSEIAHYKVNGHIFIDYDDAMNYCDKNKLSYSKIIKTKKYANGGGVGILEQRIALAKKKSKVAKDGKFFGSEVYLVLQHKTDTEEIFVISQFNYNNDRHNNQWNDYNIVFKTNEYANGGGVDNDRLWTYDIKEDRILIYPTIEFIGDEHNDIEDIKRQLRAEGYKQPFIVENSNYWTYDIKGDHILIYPTTEDDEDAVGYDVGSVMKQLRAEGYRQALVVTEKKYADGGGVGIELDYWKIKNVDKENNIYYTYLQKNVASPIPFDSVEITKEQYEKARKGFDYSIGGL